MIKAHLLCCLRRQLLDVLTSTPASRLLRRLASGAFLINVLISPASAFEIHRSEHVSLGLKGYYKNLNFASNRATNNDFFLADLNRVRTEWDARFWKILSAKLIWDNEFIGGNYVNTEEFASRQAQRDVPYLNMDYELVRKKDFFYGQNFYRAYLQLDPGFFTLKVGRQKIDWGVMRLFSPVDLFTRIPIFDVEKEERVGTTAANLTVPMGSKTRINPVYAFDSRWDRSRLGARLTQTVGHFDLSASGGRFLRDTVIGFDISGDVKKAGVRGELSYDHAAVGRNFVQFSAGIDYGFENTFYFALEYLFNGQGTNNLAALPVFPPTANQIRTVHKNFIGLRTKYDITPIWFFTMETVVDVNGASLFLNPETKYSILSWLDVASGLQIPVGKGGGEFTSLPNVYYLQTQLFF